MKIKLPEELHRQLRVTALGNGETLGGFAVRLLGGCMGGPVKWRPVQEPVEEDEAAPVKPAKVDKPKGHPLLSNIPIG